MVLDGASAWRLPDEPDQLQLAKHLDVVGDVRKRDVEFLGKLLRARFALEQYREHPGAQWMRQAADELWVLELLVERHASLTPLRWFELGGLATTLTVSSAREGRVRGFSGFRRKTAVAGRVSPRRWSRARKFLFC